MVNSATSCPYVFNRFFIAANYTRPKESTHIDIYRFEYTTYKYDNAWK